MATINTQGCAIRISDGTSPSVFSDVEEVLSFSGPSGSRSVIDVTSLSSTGREKEVGIPDYGQVSFEINYSGLNTNHLALYDLFQSGASRDFQIVFDRSPEEIYSFTAFVLNFQFQTGIDDVVKASVTLEITGTVTDNQ
jgi:predicted secreted protein